MTVTEEQAPKLFCPQQMDEKASISYGTCFGSKCMGWRWANWPGKEQEGEEPKGYCGLAGKPERY